MDGDAEEARETLVASRPRRSRLALALTARDVAHRPLTTTQLFFTPPTKRESY